MQLKCDMINVATTDISLATLFFFFNCGSLLRFTCILWIKHVLLSIANFRCSNLVILHRSLLKHRCYHPTSDLFSFFARSLDVWRLVFFFSFQLRDLCHWFITVFHIPYYHIEDSLQRISALFVVVVVVVVFVWCAHVINLNMLFLVNS